jgi:hypothetical protein
MAHDDETRTRSLAMNQARFRHSNERLRRTAAHIRFEPSDRVPFLCECADRDCFEVVMLSLEEYDRCARIRAGFSSWPGDGQSPSRRAGNRD